MFGAIAKIAGKVGSKLVRGSVSTVRTVANVPIVKQAVKATGFGAAAYSIGDVMFNRGSGGMPALPTGGMPMLPGAGAPSIVGDRGIFQNDPNIVAALQPWVISKTNLRQYYRSPIKGYVIRYDSNGDPYAIPKTLARQYLGWKPAKKPPISVGEYQALKKADRTVKKMRKVYSMMARVDANTTKGGKVIVRRKGKK